MFEINMKEVNGSLPVEIDKGIFVIENFLTKEETELLHSLAEAADEEQWDLIYLNSLRTKAEGILGSSATKEEVDKYVEEHTVSFWKDKKLEIADRDLAKRITDRAQELFEGLYDTTPLTEFQRQYSGVSLDEHYDQGHDARLVRATVTYVNDNYVDGELYFPDRDLVFRPKAGTMITFPASKDYVHGVKKVGEGPTRYVITSFAWAHGSAGYNEA